jgi:membrane protein
MTTGKNQPRAAKRDNFRFGLATTGDILGDAWRNYRKNGDMNQAAAIALYAILSLIPLFILTLLIVNHLFSANPEIRERLFDGIRQFIPSFSGALLTQFGQIAGKKDLLGFGGIISLIWFSAMIFSAIEQAMNLIFRSQTYRNYFVSKLLAIAMIPLGWAVGVVSVGMTYAATILAKQPLFLRGEFLFLSDVHGAVVRYLLPYLVTVVFFTAVYKVIPTAKVGLKSALVGGAIFSALMAIATHFFAWHVANYTRYDVIFGPLEAVVILVFWVFYVAIIFLFCAEFIDSYQRRDMVLLEKAFLKPGKRRLKINEQLFRRFGRFYGPNEYIFHEGDTGQDLFYILHGRVRMEKRAGQAKKILAEMGPGEYFGEMAALIDAPRTASARSLEESHIAVIGADTLHTILRESDEVSLFMLKEFSNRIRNTNAALEELSRSWIRLTATLYFLRTWPIPEDRNPVEEIAKATNKEPVEIQEVLAELGRQGILTFGEGRVTGFSREEAWRLLDEHVSA